MGQKVNPIGLRLGIIRDWDSRWFATKHYRDFVLEDERIRKFFRTKFSRTAVEARLGTARGRDRGREAGISRIEVERAANNVKVTLHTAKPGIIIGRGGKGVDDIRQELERETGRKVHLNVQEVRQPELEALLVADAVAGQIEKRVAFKRAIRQAITRTMRAGAKGIRVMAAGRLGGSEMARTYSDRDGKIPLHTLRADIDYGTTEAKTPSGNIGIKVWVYRGDVLPGAKEAPARPAAAPAAPKERVGWRRVPRAEMAPGGEQEAAQEAEAAAEVPEAAAAPAPEALETPEAPASDGGEVSEQEQPAPE